MPHRRAPRSTTARPGPLRATIVAAAAALALAGCSEPTAGASAQDTPSVTATSATATATSSSATSPSASPSATPSGTASAACTGAAADLPAGPALTGVNDLAATTVNVLFTAARTCDRTTLVTRAEADGTHLSFGMMTPQEAFDAPDREDRYVALVRTLATAPVEDTLGGRALYVWPAVASRAGDTEAGWRQAVDAGLLTTAEAQQMRAAGNGYTGWRVGVAGYDGTWQFMVAGD